MNRKAIEEFWKMRRWYWDVYFNRVEKKKRRFEIKKLSKAKLEEIEKSMGGLKPTENDLKRIESAEKKKRKNKKMNKKIIIEIFETNPEAFEKIVDDLVDFIVSYVGFEGYNIEIEDGE